MCSSGDVHTSGPTCGHGVDRNERRAKTRLPGHGYRRSDCCHTESTTIAVGKNGAQGSSYLKSERRYACVGLSGCTHSGSSVRLRVRALDNVAFDKPPFSIS